LAPASAAVHPVRHFTGRETLASLILL